MLQSLVFLPIEIKNRELEARMLTACHLLARGVTVVLGQQWGIFVNAQSWPRGAILFKTMNQIQGTAMRVFAQSGHLVVGSDEEVLTSVSDFFTSFSDIAAKSCHLFLAQSEPHAAAVRARFPFLASHVGVTGNARVEVMSHLGPAMFGAQTAAIKQEYGRYILINTNYATANSIWGKEDALNVCVQAGVVDPNDPASVAKFNAAVDWEHQNQVDMRAFLTWAMANIKTHRIVIRPHPAEKPGYWEEFVGNLPNVTVMRKSHHVPWIMGADLVVHTSCTTGLETAFLHRPALNIERTVDPFSSRITSTVNYTVRTPEEAIAAAEPYLRDGSGPLSDVHRFDDLLEANYPGFKNGGTAELIAKHICVGLRQHGAVLGQPMEWPEPRTYNPLARTEIMKEKITLDINEVSAAVQMAMQHIGWKASCRIAQLDDSLFLLEPA